MTFYTGVACRKVRPCADLDVIDSKSYTQLNELFAYYCSHSMTYSTGVACRRVQSPGQTLMLLGKV